ncbi:MAG TPA: HU family DNA-binding protein [Stellaceae bacterium]|nr:HU family DNA-binding protein [Stellaceae bacterium]HKR19991.1 HU family DNA-binding protein [Stellaceae bacterium]HYL33206.1 HU family DNA-binding protein [Stellaceae bacterium]HYL50073.1 HU family DNA-binding protein [Stellaceae bacterium]HYM04437.1 HU family DNA-binding protein [Stellaceae bacterium]
MNKNELVDAVATAATIKKSEAETVIDAVFDSITKELKKGGEVRLTGFGTFVVSQRAATEGRNPRTGETIKIAARKVPRFRAGKGLKDAIA